VVYAESDTAVTPPSVAPCIPITDFRRGPGWGPEGHEAMLLNFFDTCYRLRENVGKSAV
jgi:hypothetical protein